MFRLALVARARRARWSVVLILICTLFLLFATDRTGYAAPPPGSEISSPEAAAGRRPNIVFLLTDDLRFDALGFVQRSMNGAGRFPFIQNATPNIDRIASEGVYFRNAFVTSSLCSPSRSAMLTGRYPHMTGVVDNRTAFPVESETYATLLREAGYRTGYFGKWHMAEQTARPGFDQYASYVGQGVYFDARFLVDGVATPTKGWVDDIATDYALSFIRINARLGQPFVAVVGFKTPHGPLLNMAPARNANLFSDATLDTPINARHKPPYFPDGAPSWFDTRQMQGYFRLLAGVDENVGRVLEVLDQENITRDTVVVFASDNGFHMTEHGSPRSNPVDGEKRSAYESSIHIPLLISHPGTIKPAMIRTAVLNIDLAPTFLGMAGLPPSPGMQGKDLAPLLRGTATSVRSAFFYEYFEERGFVVPTIKAYRTNRYKLIEFPANPEYGREFYDLVVDPWETRNIVDEPSMQSVVNSVKRDLDASALSLKYVVPTPKTR